MTLGEEARKLVLKSAVGGDADYIKELLLAKATSGGTCMMVDAHGKGDCWKDAVKAWLEPEGFEVVTDAGVTHIAVYWE
jgi:hypothetical protein